MQGKRMCIAVGMYGRVWERVKSCRNACRKSVARKTGNVRETVLDKGCVSATNCDKKAPKLSVYGAFRGCFGAQKRNLSHC